MRPDAQCSASMDGFGVSGFRSFGADEVQYVGPMGHVHLLVGPNDAGKSNLLRMMARALPALHGRTPMQFDPPHDQPGQPDPDGFARPCVAVHVPLDEERAQTVTTDRLTYGLLRQLLARASFRGEGPPGPATGVWFEFAVAVEGDHRATEHTLRQRTEVLDAARQLPGMEIGNVAVELGCGRRGDEADATAVLDALAERLGVFDALPATRAAAPQRQLSPETAGALRGLRLPGLDFTGKQERFQEVTDFVGEVLDRPAFSLEPTEDGDDIVATFEDGPKRPAASFGAGLSQLIVLAVEATDPDLQLVLMEEPEVHLHPTMQRRLLARLSRDTAHQYVIATHSAQLLNAEHVSITAVTRRGAWSRTAPASMPGEVASLARDLGFRASDLVQANFIVWVEGPSDRIYVRHWLRALDPSLIEGVHFALVSYGGSLLRYLSPEDQPTPELTALPRLNRNFAVVVDSDRTSFEQALTPPKQRFLEAFREVDPDATLWVTQGYTIENYIQTQRLRDAVAAVHNGAQLRWDGDQGVDPLGPDQLSRANPAKVRIATAVCVAAADTWRADTDAREQTAAIIAGIRRANDLPR